MTESRNQKGASSGWKADGTISTSDVELVSAVRQGDKRAFVEIVSRHQAMVCGIAFGILGDFAASEDAGQETFLTAWRKFHELREPERLRAWLAQIARNAALGHRRRTRGNDPLESAPDLADESPLPDEVLAHKEEAALVRATLARLPETYRLPLVLYYREDQSVRAVAAALNISEDAVKQRLARGREMLHDQMSGLIENVLSRTSPSPVFTMTIAVAIGALAAPAAMAGSIFTATSVATSAASTTTTTTSTSLLAIMNTSKAGLVVTALVAAAFIPVGYNISTDGPTPDESRLISKVETTDAQTPASLLAPSYENSALFVEWRELHEKHGTNATAMPALYQAISEHKDSFRRRAFHSALIAEWVRLDAANGLKFYLGNGPDSVQRRQFIEEWLELDPVAAADALLASAPGWEKVARSCLGEIARRAPSRLAPIVARLPRTESHWDTTVQDAFAIIAKEDLGSARRAAEAMEGPHREQALAGVAHSWARSDFKNAVAWAQALTDGMERDQIIRAALSGVAAVDPALALESVNLVPPGGKEGYFADTTAARVLKQAAAANFENTVQWLQNNPGRFSGEDLTGLSEVVTARLNADPIEFLNTHMALGSFSVLQPAIQSAVLNDAGGQREKIWEWLKTQPENETTRALRNNVMNSAAWQDPELALRMVADIPQTKEGDREVQGLAQRLLNGGSALHRFDKLLGEVPERLRGPFVEEAFRCLSRNMDDPQPWITRLTLLPEGSRDGAIASIAGAWAMQMPEEAIEWAASFSGATRHGAISSITSSWASTDAHGAAEWINSMPAGVERDRGSEALAFAIVEKHPREAWDWALRIGDSNRRNHTTIQVAASVASRNPATVREWIETGPFSPEARASLQSSIERQVRSRQ